MDEVKLLNRIVVCLVKVSEVFSGLLLIAATLAVFLQVIARTFLGFSFNWAEELPCLLYVWMATISTGVCYYNNQHIKLELFVRRFSERGQVVFQMISHILVAAFCFILAVYGTKMSISIWNTKFLTFPITKSLLYWPIAISAAVVFLSCAIRLIELSKAVFSHKEDGQQEDTV